MTDTEKISYETYLNKIILTYPVYYKIFEKYYNEGKNIKYELDRIYEPIFIGIMEFYYKYMTEGINEIISQIKNKYKPDKPYAIIDFIEFLFGNILYETFLTEIKKIDKKNISYEYLCIFEYIIRVELVKYKLYLEVINKIDSGNKILLAMKFRKENCVKKISFCIGYLEKNYFSHTNIITLCYNLITELNLDIKIDTDIINNTNSFINISKITNNYNIELNKL